MTRLLALALVVALAACANAPRRGQPSGTPPPAGPALLVEAPLGYAQAKDFAERVAARCYLDGVLGAAQMVVDRQTGRIVLVDQTTDLLAIDLVGSRFGRTTFRFSGPSVGLPDQRVALLTNWNRAVETGETACPPIV